MASKYAHILLHLSFTEVAHQKPPRRRELQMEKSCLWMETPITLNFPSRIIETRCSRVGGMIRAACDCKCHMAKNYMRFNMATPHHPSTWNVDLRTWKQPISDALHILPFLALILLYCFDSSRTRTWRWTTGCPQGNLAVVMHQKRAEGTNSNIFLGKAATRDHASLRYRSYI